MAKIDLTDKPIVITGASSGIGYATALECSHAGMPVVAVARRGEKLEALVKDIEGRGGRAITCVGDVNDPEVSKSAVATCIDAFGTVYSVFANAGYGFEAPVHETGVDRMREIFETNFFSNLYLIDAALPEMVRAGRGHILLCSSCIGKMALPYFGAYSATKAAQWHIGRAMNMELRDSGIRTSTVHPVGTKTDFFDTAKSMSTTPGATLGEHTPELFMQNAETVAKAIVGCLRKPKPEVWPSWSRLVRFGMGIGMMIPRFTDAPMRRLVREYQKAEAKKDGAG